MSEENLLLKFRLRTFSDYAILAIGAVLVYALWVFGRMFLDGERNWVALLILGSLGIFILGFFYLLPWRMTFKPNEVLVRYWIGRMTRFELRDLSEWQWWTNQYGNSGLRLTFRSGRRLVIPPMFADERIPALLNRHATIRNQTERG